jgi:hypothetical protein
MSVRKWYVSEALTSFARLSELLPELTEEEVLACLRLESASNRRGTVIDRLISRAVRLNEIAYAAKLKKEFSHDPHHQEHDPG